MVTRLVRNGTMAQCAQRSQSLVCGVSSGAHARYFGIYLPYVCRKDFYHTGKKCTTPKEIDVLAGSLLRLLDFVQHIYDYMATTQKKSPALAAVFCP